MNSALVEIADDTWGDRRDKSLLFIVALYAYGSLVSVEQKTKIGLLKKL